MAFFNRNKSTIIIDDKLYLKPNNKIGLALSGGGARGFAHIGALKAFEEMGLRFDFVAGTSAGSIAGALYCAGLSIEEIERQTLKLQKRDILSSPIPLVASNPISVENLVNKLIGYKQFEELQIPLSAVAVDIITGEEVILNKGNVGRAVSASSSVPIIFSPVIMGQYRLVDGGLLNTIPADVARVMGAEYVISVDINSTRGGGTTSTNVLETAYAVWNITMKTTALKGILNSDIVIEPNLSRFKPTRLEGGQEMIEEGYNAAMAKKDEIMELLGIKTKKN